MLEAAQQVAWGGDEARFAADLARRLSASAPSPLQHLAAVLEAGSLRACLAAHAAASNTWGGSALKHVAELRQLDESHGRRRDERSALRAQRAQAHACISEIGACSAEGVIEELQRRLDDAVVQASMRERERDDACIRCEAAVRDVATAQQAAESEARAGNAAREAVSTLQADLSKQAELCAALQHALDAVHGVLRASEASGAVSLQELRDATSRLSGLELDVNATRSAGAALERELQHAQRSVTDALSSSCAAAEREAALRQDLDVCQTEVADLRRRQAAVQRAASLQLTVTRATAITLEPEPDRSEVARLQAELMQAHSQLALRVRDSVACDCRLRSAKYLTRNSCRTQLSARRRCWNSSTTPAPIAGSRCLTAGLMPVRRYCRCLLCKLTGMAPCMRS